MGTQEQSTNGGGVATASDTLSVTDNRTGKAYEIPIEDGTIRAPAMPSMAKMTQVLPISGSRPHASDSREEATTCSR